MARHNAKHEKRKARSMQKKPVSAKKPINQEESRQFQRKIKVFLQMTAKGQLHQKELSQKCHSRRNPSAYQNALEVLHQEGWIREQGQYYILCSQENAFKAETVRLSTNFGFIRDENGTDYFVPGKYLMGSMPGDKVLAKPIPSRSGSPEAQVISILEETEHATLTGRIIPTEHGLCLLSSVAWIPLGIDYDQSCEYHINDRVLCELTFRGMRHMDHKVKVIQNFGSADSAANCMKSRIAELEIPCAFREPVRKEAKKVSALGVTEFDLQGRKDFRDEMIFTIDGAYSKDLDDAVSIRKHANGWTLGVHIADVSYYVRPNSQLDAEAFRRGTSIYYADQVIPMLPPDLSNGICSLNQGENRLTLSAVMEISPEGDLINAEFYQSVICSRVRGVYEECNQILDGTADPDLQEKYADVKESLFLLNDLAERLEHVRKLRGAPELESTESVILTDHKGVCTGLAPVQRGKSERIIESCMLCANEAAARLARTKQIPFVYRVHESPAPERIASLKEMLLRLGQTPPVTPDDEISPADIQKILDASREESYFPVINNLTLRSMAKARYSPEPLGHFGLALKDYAHFTSPIRRYPDLTIHRIINDILDGADADWLQKRYAKFTQNAAERSSDTELQAVQLEREADACYAAEYMQNHVGEIFAGVITSVTDFGLYVTLSNMAEGLLHIYDLPEGQYQIQEGWYVKNNTTNIEYKLGDALNVICIKADVSSGHIDLALA